MMKFALLLAPIALSACATTPMADAGPDPELVRALADRVQSGPPQSCLSLLQTRDQTRYRNAIVVRDGRTWWLNEMRYCPALTQDTILVNRVTGSQVCRGDIVHLVDRTGGMMRGACSYGEFVPYRKADDLPPP